MESNSAHRDSGPYADTQRLYDFMPTSDCLAGLSAASLCGTAGPRHLQEAVARGASGHLLPTSQTQRSQLWRPILTCPAHLGHCQGGTNSEFVPGAWWPACYAIFQIQGVRSQTGSEALSVPVRLKRLLFGGLAEFPQDPGTVPLWRRNFNATMVLLLHPLAGVVACASHS